MHASTFSIVARIGRTGEFGVASATAIPCVGALVPYAAEGVGAIATQAWVNVNLGFQGIEMMRSGLSVGAAIEALLRDDEGKSKRQVIGIDHTDVFGYSGEDCSGVKGHRLLQDHAVAGNLLSSERVLDQMSEVFKTSKGDLSSRLISALEAGQAAGGDRRGKKSAVVLVASPKYRLYNDIRVDLSDDPIRELRRIHDECARISSDHDDDGEVLRKRITRVSRAPNHRH